MGRNTDNGWIKLHRKLLDSPIWGSPGLVTFWIWCLMKANTSKKYTFYFNSTEVTLKPGQFITGRKIAAEETGISECSVRKYFKILEKQKMIKRKVTNRYTLVTIVNWGNYQGDDSKAHPTKHPTKHPSEYPTEHPTKYPHTRSNIEGVFDPPSLGGLDPEKIMGEVYDPNKMFYKEDGKTEDWDTVWLYEELWEKRRNGQL